MLKHIHRWKSVFVAWSCTCLCMGACVCSQVDACVWERWTHHIGWQVWAVDHKWGHWLKACLCSQACPNLPTLSLPNFKPLFTLMDTLSYFPSTLGCCIIKCHITFTHRSDQNFFFFFVCGRCSTRKERQTKICWKKKQLICSRCAGLVLWNWLKYWGQLDNCMRMLKS